MGKSSYYAHGKLLLTSEYGVLDGALGLAIPTKYGQKMHIKQTRKSDLFWKSYDHLNNEWFSAQISLYDFSPIKSTDDAKASFLNKVLKGAVSLNSEFLSKWNGFDVKTELEFDKAWGLGSSSSMVYLVATWAGVNPLLLHFEVSKGSGYDVAAAGADLPITYKLGEESVNYQEVDFNPKFKDQLYFIYLNQKQDSKVAIEHYFKKGKQKKTMVKKLTALTEAVLTCNTCSKFVDLIKEHEEIISEHLSLETVMKRLGFDDFEGGIKSLGAWGGDFILAASEAGEDYVRTYFASKGYATFIPYDEMILQESEQPATIA